MGTESVETPKVQGLAQDMPLVEQGGFCCLTSWIHRPGHNLARSDAV